MPLVGFLPVRDARVRGTVAAIERELVEDGFVKRYAHDDSEEVDGLPLGEGAFLPCTFWLADNLALMGRRDEARRLFERLLALRNDVGLLAEEYDVRRRPLVGNFPQAFTHVGEETGTLRVDIPGYTEQEFLAALSWEEFFRRFEAKRLAFVYEDESPFFQFVERTRA